MNVAVIWGHHRNDKDFTTHHSFFERTLRDDPALKVTRYIWPEMLDMPKDHDLYFFIDFDESLYKLYDSPFHPRIWTWWDGFHRSWAYVSQAADLFDRSYFMEKTVANPLIDMGIKNVRWMPPAYYEGCYFPIKPQPEKLHQFSFVGQPDHTVKRKGTTRKEMIEMLAGKFRGYVGQGVYGAAVNQIYNESLVCVDRRIGFNIGTRFFETIGSGAFLLTNKNRVDDGTEDLAVDGCHFVSYDDSFEDLEKKVRYYIDRPEERLKIATAGHKFFHNNHRYYHRWHAILKDLGFEK